MFITESIDNPWIKGLWKPNITARQPIKGFVGYRQ